MMTPDRPVIHKPAGGAGSFEPRDFGGSGDSSRGERLRQGWRRITRNPLPTHEERGLLVRWLAHVASLVLAVILLIAGIAIGWVLLCTLLLFVGGVWLHASLTGRRAAPPGRSPAGSDPSP